MGGRRHRAAGNCLHHAAEERATAAAPLRSRAAAALQTRAPARLAPLRFCCRNAGKPAARRHACALAR